MCRVEVLIPDPGRISRHRERLAPVLEEFGQVPVGPIPPQGLGTDGEGVAAQSLLVAPPHLGGGVVGPAPRLPPGGRAVLTKKGAEDDLGLVPLIAEALVIQGARRLGEGGVWEEGLHALFYRNLRR